MLLNEGVEIIPSRKYSFLGTYSVTRIYQPLEHHARTLTDVLGHIRAETAWKSASGDGVHIAIVDTGICGGMPEFPPWKRSSFRPPAESSPWTDLEGHGSMTACIAAATRKSGGRYDGVAPGAKLIACKTEFDDTELYEIYDYLLGLVERREIGRLVVNNSYGQYVCAPPRADQEDPLPTIIRGAVERGVVVVFAAGNNHVNVCGYDPLRGGPNSIWGVNSMEEVISVGTVNENNRMDQPPSIRNGFSHRDSSRGPGQLARNHAKPDCVALTYGEVMWGGGYSAMEWWGTSGAAPQVAGLAALLLEKKPDLTPAQVQEIICETSIRLPLDGHCAGAGLIDCAAALGRVSQPG